MSRWISSAIALGALALAAGAWMAPAIGDAGPSLPAPTWIREADPASPLGPDELAFRWYGTAAFQIRTAQGALLIDPHFSRHTLWQLVSGPIAPDLARIQAHLPPAQAVFVGHAHHDHLIDAPDSARLLGAPFYGSEDACRVARAAGLSEALVHPLHGRERIAIGDMVVEAVPSKHSFIVTNHLVAGDIAPQVTLPMRFWDYKHGPVFAYRISWRGRTLYHFGSADLVEAELKDAPRADVLMLCLSGWRDNPGVFARMRAALHPSVLVPMHHDDFFRPIESGFHPGQLAFVPGAMRRVREEMPDAAAVPEDLLREYRVTAKEPR